MEDCDDKKNVFPFRGGLRRDWLNGPPQGDVSQGIAEGEGKVVPFRSPPEDEKGDKKSHRPATDPENLRHVADAKHARADFIRNSEVRGVVWRYLHQSGVRRAISDALRSEDKRVWLRESRIQSIRTKNEIVQVCAPLAKILTLRPLIDEPQVLSALCEWLDTEFASATSPRPHLLNDHSGALYIQWIENEIT